MCFIYHFKQARALFNASLAHPTNIPHASQEQRAKMNKVSLIKAPVLSYTWSSGTTSLFGKKGLCGRRVCIIIKMTQYPEKTSHWPKSGMGNSDSCSHGDIKESSLKMKDTHLKVICGEVANRVYTPVLSTQNTWPNDSKIWHGISQKDRAYGVEDNRRWEIKLEEVTREVFGEWEGWHASSLFLLQKPRELPPGKTSQLLKA